jgi:Domain of unknown function (DUF4158)
MISPTDTACRLLPTSPSARELMDAYTPGLFELKFAEERTRQAAPRVGLLVLLKTFQQLGYFVKVADVPDSVLRQVAEAAGYDVVPQELDNCEMELLVQAGFLPAEAVAIFQRWSPYPATTPPGPVGSQLAINRPLCRTNSRSTIGGTVT